MSLCIERRRLLGRGDIPGSNGGIYNPGVVSAGGSLALLCRREVDYRFTPFVFPELVELDPESLAPRCSRTLRKIGYPEGSRIEDFRPIAFKGSTLVAHTLVHPGAIKPVLSRIVDDTLQFHDPFDLPIDRSGPEKNWVLFEHGGALHCLHSLDPLTIFAQTADGGWRLVKQEVNGLRTLEAATVSNSANLIPFEDGYLGFWHTRIDGRQYVQGALFLDAHLNLQDPNRRASGRARDPRGLQAGRPVRERARGPRRGHPGVLRRGGRAYGRRPVRSA